ncbi:conjugal transfer protein TraK [Vibrio halioticoli NBRC 102217]|uniref:Conjugal transfer protein TraK n=1 Tax=Vibrio halioticoli NBRC 102217 TaxID=1219072 RepID=V5FE75_9VIBR|nr:type-F conjugative transfer system secretin TraK [Vibrio halioticoli]GAD89953.1 conjugal transfer protein TraK [Vibrio halioticoli NBRC 102217]
MNIKHLLILTLLPCVIPVSATELAVVPSTTNSNNQSNSAGNSEKQSAVHVISSKHVNRIVTPFKNPSVKLDAVEGVATKSQGNVLYLSTSSSQPIAGFITESGDESTSIKVIFRPMPVAPQEVILKGSTNEGSELARRFERSNPRSETIKNVMGSLVRGELPNGYQMKKVNAQYLPSCKQSGLTFNFYNGQFVTGGDYVVSIGIAENRSTQAVNFTENSCYKDGVVAISAYPTTTLLPNEKTEVFVMFYRNKPVSTQQKTRRSLIGG